MGATEKISVGMTVSGDLQGEYIFAGPLGNRITASSEASAGATCEISSLFRKLQYRSKNSIEAWLTLNCMFEGQKSSYRTHRIYLSLDKPRQKVKLPMLAKNLRNIQLEFHELSLKLGK